MNLPMDPDEQVGTPEYDELREDRESRYALYLDLLSEEEDYDCVQFPQRFSH